MPVNTIAQKLFLQTNMVTSLPKCLEKQGIVERRKGGDDERKVLVFLTEKGRRMEQQAADIPFQLMKEIPVGDVTLKS